LATGIDARRFRRGQLLAAALFAAAIAGVLAYDVIGSPDVPFLSRRDAPWIVAQTPIQTHGMEIDLAHPPTSFFARPFVTGVPPGPVTVHVRALREVTLYLNNV
jgi:hypothetical protein